jgi:8-oxo-dGTP pyrophosphatase MutT (NUDIX family)
VAVAGAAAIVFDGDGRVLLVREGYRRRRWSLPGGRIEPAELPHEAAVREAREETGLEVVPVEVVGLYRLHGERVFDVYAFLCSADGVAAADGHEITTIAWADPVDLPAPMTNVVAAAVPDAAAGNRGVVRSVEWKPMRDAPLAPLTA